MFFKENPKSEQLSQSIDAEIERKLSERLREVQESLDQRVQKTTHDDREFVKETIGVAFKIAGIAVAIVVFVLGVLGWKTYDAINKAVTDAAANKANEYFSTPQGRRIIDSTLDRSVLDSYLIRIALMKTDTASYKDLKMDDYDAERLLRIVNSDKVDDATFESAADVLIVAFGSPGRTGTAMLTEVGEAFAVFISAKNKDAKWLERNRTKRAWLLGKLSQSSFSEDQIKTACRELISSDAPNEFKLGAIMYLGTVKDNDALDKLVDIALTGKDLRLSALLALAKINPKNEVLTKWIAELDRTPAPAFETVVAALEMSGVLISDNDTRLKLMDFASRHSRLAVSAWLGSNSLLGYTMALGSETKKALDYLIVFDPAAPRTSKQIISSVIIDREDDNWSAPANGLLEKYAQQQDLKDFLRFVTWLTMQDYIASKTGLKRPPVLGVKILLSEDSEIHLKNGETANRQSAPNGVFVSAIAPEANSNASDQLQIKWIDAKQEAKSAVVLGFKNAGAFRFKCANNAEFEEEVFNQMLEGLERVKMLPFSKP